MILYRASVDSNSSMSVIVIAVSLSCIKTGHIGLLTIVSARIQTILAPYDTKVLVTEYVVE